MYVCVDAFGLGATTECVEPIAKTHELELSSTGGAHDGRRSCCIRGRQAQRRGKGCAGSEEVGRTSGPP